MGGVGGEGGGGGGGWCGGGQGERGERREDQILIKMKRKTIKRVGKRKKLFEWVEKPLELEETRIEKR